MHAVGATTRVGVDVGGTFTDLVAFQNGTLTTAKVPSTPEDQSLGVMASIASAGAEPAAIDELAHGMTVATNALLERRGAKTAFVTTEGFRDLLEIARQERPSLYDLAEQRPPALVPRPLRFTVKERTGPDGEIEPLDPDSLTDLVRCIADANVEAVAVCLLFSFMHPEHEQEVGRALRGALSDVDVSLSSEVLPEFREFERASTVAADAYVRPRLGSYLNQLASRLEEAGGPAPLVMQSSGGVTDIEGAVSRPAACLLSGPAGGVVGAAHVAELSGHGDVLTFDMGGTSTDVAPVVDGAVQTTTESIVAGVPVRFSMVDVHTVSAGGGSIAWVDEGGALRVGPESAGADPGPVAYGRGGRRPTVTDANLLLGYLSAGAVLGGAVRLDPAPVETAFKELGSQLGMSALDAALGVVRVADAEMTRALRVISVERGLDPRDFALVAFGGAGPLHACSLAQELEMDTVLVPKAGGVLSALGLALSDLRRDYVKPLLGDLDHIADKELERCFLELEAEAARDLGRPVCEREADVRYRGQAYELTVSADDASLLRQRFEAAHDQRYGFRVDNSAAEIVSIRLTASVRREPPEIGDAGQNGSSSPDRREIHLAGEWTEVAILDRLTLGPGAPIEGPAIIEFPDTTCLARPGWHGEIDDIGTLILRRQ